MLFSSLTFLCLFLPIVMVTCVLLAPRYRNGWLLAASLFFYAWGEPHCVILLLVSSLVNFLLGLSLNSLSDELRRKLLLTAGIAFNVLILFFYKYFNFTLDIFTTPAWQEANSIPQILLPIGISFFTFQGLSYLVDVYRRECQVQRNIIDFGLYIAFFPQLIAGPIIKYHDIALQLSHRQMSVEKFAYGVRRFIYGLSKKIMIANTVALVADQIFNAGKNITTGEAWLGAICYLFQIYYDFSGYSDMAIGLAAMFGFTFRENFNYPFVARSIREFWRRWHISLSTWFKEYVYIPLGGGKVSNWKVYRNLLIVFLLTGIWHGSNWTFVVWGLFHGFFIVFERMAIGHFLERHRVLSHIYTLLVVLIGFVFFRADSLQDALRFLGTMFGMRGIVSPYANISSFLIVILVIALTLSGWGQSVCKLDFTALRLNERKTVIISESLVLSCLLVGNLCLLAMSSYNPFIYFRF